MRNAFVAVALMVAVVGGLGFVQRAEAGVSYQLVFRSTDILGGALNGVGGGTSTFSFSTIPEANNCSSASTTPSG